METTTRAITIQATKVVLIGLVITAISLDISKKIYAIKKGMNKQIPQRTKK